MFGPMPVRQLSAEHYRNLADAGGDDPGNLFDRVLLFAPVPILIRYWRSGPASQVIVATAPKGSFARRFACDIGPHRSSSGCTQTLRRGLSLFRQPDHVRGRRVATFPVLGISAKPRASSSAYLLAGGRDLEHDPEKWKPVFPRDKREAFARRSCSNEEMRS